MPLSFAIAAAMGAYAASQHESVLDKAEAEIHRRINVQKSPNNYGWKCSGCKATNASHESMCSWCRSYRIGK